MAKIKKLAKNDDEVCEEIKEYLHSWRRTDKVRLFLEARPRIYKDVYGKMEKEGHIYRQNSPGSKGQAEVVYCEEDNEILLKVRQRIDLCGQNGKRIDRDKPQVIERLQAAGSIAVFRDRKHKYAVGSLYIKAAVAAHPDWRIDNGKVTYTTFW